MVKNHLILFICIFLISCSSVSIEPENIPQHTPPQEQNSCGNDVCEEDEFYFNCPEDCIDTTERQDREEKETIDFKPVRETQPIVVESILSTSQNNNYRKYIWYYEGDRYAIEGELDEKAVETYRTLDRHRDYDLFVSSPYNKKLVEDIAERLEEQGRYYGLREEEIPSLAASFVQSLEYTSDDVTTGYDEYPRFPYETLWDEGGDCEDTAILTASILRELGYGVVLILLPRHVAVGVKCDDDYPGSYYEYEGSNYCYLETTGEGWKIGDMPEEHQGKMATIFPVYERPELKISFDGKTKPDYIYTYVDLDITVKNIGSLNAEDVQVYVALETTEEGKVWDQILSDEFTIKPEGSVEYSVTNLKVPNGEIFRTYVRAFGDNVISDETTSEWT